MYLFLNLKTQLKNHEQRLLKIISVTRTSKMDIPKSQTIFPDISQLKPFPGSATYNKSAVKRSI